MAKRKAKSEVNAATETPDSLRQPFQSDQPLWFKNGRWGDWGYGFPNPAGKTSTNNTTLYKVHKLLGRTMFDLLHREAVQLDEPPHVDFWFDVHKSLVIGRERLLTRRLAPDENRTIKTQHVRSTPQTFLVFPVPHFGRRIRQEDVAELGELGMTLLSEMMQHSANEKQYWLSDTFVDMCIGYINEMLTLFATKYFGFTRESFAKEAGFVIPPELFMPLEEGGIYRPWEKTTSFERSTERPPQLYWPTENDLSELNGMAITEAMKFGGIWPEEQAIYEGDHETTAPGYQASQRYEAGNYAASGRRLR